MHTTTTTIHVARPVLVARPRTQMVGLAQERNPMNSTDRGKLLGLSSAVSPAIAVKLRPSNTVLAPLLQR